LAVFDFLSYRWSGRGLFFIGISPLHFASRFLGRRIRGHQRLSRNVSLTASRADIEFKYFYFFWLIIFRFGSGEFEVPAWMAIGFGF